MDDTDDGDDEEDTVDDCSATDEVDLCGGAGSMSCGYYTKQTNLIKQYYTRIIDNSQIIDEKMRTE